MHEAIIDRGRFEAINKKFSNRRKANHKYENIFKGKIFCAECGTEMQLISKTLKCGSKPMFRCLQHVTNKSVCSHNHYMYYDELIVEIKKQLEVLVTEYINSDEFRTLCETILKSIYSQAAERRRSALQSDLTTISKRIKEYYKHYSMTAQDIFQPCEFDDLLEKQKSLIQKIGEVNSEAYYFVDNGLRMDEIMFKIKKHISNIIHCENNIKYLIKRIEIGHLEKISNGTGQKITLHYNF